MSGMYRLECTSLLGVNKAGILKPNEHGEYTVVLGALNFPNSRGMEYDKASFESILNGNNDFTRRLKKGQLTGELGHPKRLDWMKTQEDYLNRMLDVWEENESHTITEIVIDTTCRDNKGRNYVGIIGKVIPSGKQGHILKQKLDNPKLNPCFSIRSITVDKYVGGRIVRYLKNVVTFDFVIEAGLEPANKYDSPALESYSAIPITPSSISQCINQYGRLGLESSGGANIAREIEASMKNDNMITPLKELNVDKIPHKKVKW